MLQNIKDFVLALLTSKKAMLVGMIVRWAMKVIGGVMLSFGVTQKDAEITIASVATILLSIIISLIQSGKIAFSLPEEFKKK